MKDAVIIAMSIVALFAVLSWASAPSAVLAEQKLRIAAEAKTAKLETQVAVLFKPSPTPRRPPF